jgi:hypothetical protein
MPSITQLYRTAVQIKRADDAGKTTYIYQFGDHDPTGVIIPETIERRLEELCDKLECQYPIVERIALTKKQIEKYRLPIRPTKREGNRHAKNFEGDSVELDALDPDVLRDLVRGCIEWHITPEQLKSIRETEASERSLAKAWAGTVGGAS